MKKLFWKKKFHGTIFYLFSKENVSSIVISLENVLFQANCMVLLPKTAMVEIKVIAGTRLLSLSFDVPLNVCDKFILQSLTGLCRKLDYNFQSLAIRYPLPPYLEIVTYCLTNKMDCGHFHTLLEQELFFFTPGFLSERRISLIVPPDHLSRINFQRFCHWQLF